MADEFQTKQMVRLDDDYFIIFENDFEEYEKNNITLEELNNRITKKITQMGYRILSKRPSAEEMEDAIWNEIIRDGEVIFYQLADDFGDFTKLGQVDDPTVDLYEITKGEYVDNDFEEGVVWTVHGKTNLAEAMKSYGHAAQMGIVEKADRIITESEGELAEVEWDSGMKYNVAGFNFYGWFTNAVLIPQPYNMRLPIWLVNRIKSALTNTKV